MSKRFYRARLHEPDEFIRIRTEEEHVPGESDPFGPDITVVWGVKKVDGEENVEIQALLFDREKFTLAETKRWLKRHEFKALQIDDPDESEETEETEETEDPRQWQVIDSRLSTVETSLTNLTAEVEAMHGKLQELLARLEALQKKLPWPFR